MGSYARATVIPTNQAVFAGAAGPGVLNVVLYALLRSGWKLKS